MHKVGSGLELRGGLFSFYVAVFTRTVIIPLFYHLAVLDYKPCYSQEPWLLKTTLVGKFSKIRNKYLHLEFWHFGMYDIPSERQEFNLYGSIKIV